MTREDTTLALSALRTCRSSLLLARLDALTSVVRLSGARASRVGQLSELIADAQAFAERVIFLLEADVAADDDE